MDERDEMIQCENCGRLVFPDEQVNGSRFGATICCRACYWKLARIEEEDEDNSWFNYEKYEMD